MSERTVDLHDLTERVRLFGELDRNLSAIEETLAVSVQTDGDDLILSGETDHTVERAAQVIRRLRDAAVDGAHITPEDVTFAVTDTENNALPGTLLRTMRGREVRPRSNGQRAFVQSIDENVLTIGIGPAGTGKTYLAIVKAVQALRNRNVERVILSRPAVEAGEKLGFLPGDLREKTDPYMRPLFDALNDLIHAQMIERQITRGTLEVAPLAYMRGRTLSDAFIILDEAQNATSDQIKMFLTRLGSGSKMVVTGDVTQIDLPSGDRSGLRDAANRLNKLEGIGIVELDERDVVRHPLVSAIIRAYANDGKAR